jgi:hypothetical protein
MFGTRSPGGRLGMYPGALPEEPGRDDSCNVEDEKFVALKKFTEFQKLMIFEPTCGAIQ